MVKPREVVIKHVEERLKIHIVKEVESGKKSQMEVSREYGFSRSAIQKWLKQYGKLRSRVKIVEVVMKDEKEKIRELRQALGDAHLKIRYYEKLIELANAESGVDLKKKLDTKVSESLKQRE